MITATKVKEAINSVDGLRSNLKLLMYKEALEGNETIDIFRSITKQDRDLVKKIVQHDRLGKLVDNQILLNKTIWKRARQIDEMLENRMLEFQKGSIRTLKETEYDEDIFTVRGFIVNKLDDDILEIRLPMTDTVYTKIEAKI